MTINKKTPTIEIYSELQEAYNFFNKKLFNNELPECLIILNNKEKRTLGYYISKNFVNTEGKECDCIAMNPKYFAGYPIENILYTLVHEMVHLWQANFEKSPSRGYHDKIWGNKMEEIGLMPSNTGEPGGKKTGQQMHHYIIEGGILEKACKELITTEFQISWFDKYPVKTENFDLTNITNLTDNNFIIEDDEVKNKSNRVKYFCEECKINVWGKPNLNIICGLCNKDFEFEE